MTQEDAHRLAVALEQLRGSVDSGITAVRGDINLLAHRADTNRKDIDEHDGRIGALEERRFPLHVVGSIMSVTAVVLAGLAFVKGG